MLSLTGGAAVGVGDDVVVVAGLRGAGAPGEHTGQVPFGGLVGEPVGDLVLVDVELLGQVDHRLHRHRGAGDTAPGADLVGVDERAGVRHPGQVQLLVGLGVGAVIASSETWTCSTTCRCACGLGVGRVSRSRTSWWRAISPSASERRTSSDAAEPRSASPAAPTESAVSRSRASARSTSASTHTVPSKDTWWVCTCACRPSAAASRRRRRLVRHEPDDRLLDQPVHLGGADPVRERRDLVVDEPRRRRAEGDGVRGRSGGPATPAGHRPRPGPRCAGAGAAARVPHRGRPCRSRWAARPRPRTRPRRTPRPAAHPVRRPGPGCRRTGPRHRSTPPGAGPPRSRPRWSRSTSAASAAGAAVPGEREHPGSGVRCGVEVGCRRGHGSILVELVFESSVESVDFPLRIKVIRR